MTIQTFRQITYTVVSIVNLAGFALNSHLNITTTKAGSFVEASKLVVFLATAVTLALPILLILERFRPRTFLFKPPAELVWLFLLVGIHAAACFFIFRLSIPAQCDDLRNSDTSSFSACAELNTVRVVIFLDAVLLFLSAVTIWTWSTLEASNGQIHVWSTPLSRYRRTKYNSGASHLVATASHGALSLEEKKNSAYGIEQSFAVPLNHRGRNSDIIRSVADSRPVTGNSRRSSARPVTGRSRASSENSRPGTGYSPRATSFSKSRPSNPYYTPPGSRRNSQSNSRPNSRPGSRSNSRPPTGNSRGVSPSRSIAGSQHTVLPTRPISGRPDTPGSTKSKKSYRQSSEADRNSAASDTLWSSQIRPDDPFSATKFAFAIPASAPSSLSKLYSGSQEFEFANPPKPKPANEARYSSTEDSEETATIVVDPSSSSSSIQHDLSPKGISRRHSKSSIRPTISEAEPVERPPQRRSKSANNVKPVKTPPTGNSGTGDKNVPTAYRFAAPSIIYEGATPSSTPPAGSALSISNMGGLSPKDRTQF